MSYKLDMSVIARIVNIFQEAIVTGMDISVLFTEMELESSTDDERKLVMTPAYQKRVVRELARLQARAEELRAEATGAACGLKPSGDEPS